MKRLFALTTVAVLLFTLGGGALTGASSERGIAVLLNGKKIEFDVAPAIESGRTLVPVRAIFEELGMEVSYDDGAIAAKKEGLAIDLSVDSDIAFVNGEQKTLDVPSRIVDSRTLVPLRFIGEATGLFVDYISDVKTVVMNDLPSAVLEPKKHDLKTDWDSETSTKISLSGSFAAVEGPGAAAEGGIVTISKAGDYVIEGELTNGQVVINVSKNDRVHLILNGASITNKTGAAIYSPSSDKVILTVAAGTENILTDGGDNYAYALADENEPNAAIFVKDDLTINGGGALTINAGFNNAIGTKDDLLILGGNYIINAANHGLRGNDSVGIINGSFAITAGGDAIQTNNTKDEGKGHIIIEGGAFAIKAQNDAIQADGTMEISGGAFNITTGGGSAGAPAREESRPGGGRQPNQAPTQISETAGENAASMKALKAAKQMSITGGEFIIDAQDDGIHSDSNIFITGGEFLVKTGDDGIHADNAVVISGGKIDIPVCYEGIEGLGVTIIGGEISITASDDAINAADGESSGFGGMGVAPPNMPQGGAEMESMQRIMEILGAAGTDELSEEQLQELYELGLTKEQITQIKNRAQGDWAEGAPPNMPQDNWNRDEIPNMPQGSRNMGEMPNIPQGGRNLGALPDAQHGKMGEPRFSITEGAFVRIIGGTIDIWGKADGIDSNGHVYLDGGIIKINGQSNGGECALEMDGDFFVTGGELVTAGTVYTPTNGSTQPVILLSYSGTQAAGSVIKLKDSKGDTLLEYESKTSFSASGFTSASFEIGKTYSVFINDEKRIDITLNGLTTSVGEDGGAYGTMRGGPNREQGDRQPTDRELPR